MSGAKSGRRFFVPEVVQTSAMDCGPASLKAALEGFGVSVSYGRLREACQTEVDGTSIDTLEEIAKELGLAAEQVMIPPDHVFLPETKALPCIAITRLPNGFTHFVVIWRVVAGLAEVMDPAHGRRWLERAELERLLYVHEMPVPAEGFLEWGLGDDTTGAIVRRARQLGCAEVVRRALGDARGRGGWMPLAAVDAALRMTASVCRAGGIDRGRAAAMFEALYESARVRDPVVPDPYWTARPAPADPETGEEQVLLRGAVLVTLDGVRTAKDGEEANRELPADLAAALAEPPSQPLRQLLRLALGDGGQRVAAGVLFGAVAAASAFAVLEAVLLRGAFTVGRELGVVDQRLGAVAAFAMFLLFLLILDVPIAAGALRIGRRLETRLRVAFLAKIPLLGDRYLSSRPISDMAHRSHDVQVVKRLPQTLASSLRTCAELVATTAGIAWLDRASAPWAIGAAVVAALIPAAAVGPLTEGDLKMRTHAGALGRFYLDALIGLVPIRAHAADRAVRREHEALLVEWARSAADLVRTFATSDLVQSLVGVALAVGLLARYLVHGGDPTSVLLLVYWALRLPVLGQELGTVLREFPAQRNTTLRILEPLGARDEGSDAVGRDVQDTSPRAGADIAFEGVTVLAGGHTILRDVDLALRPGEHVAIVGASGAGKSSLVGVLLGWHRPTNGRVRVDGTTLDGESIAHLRERTAWVDPSMQLWNRSVLDNLFYGAPPHVEATLPRAVDTADLQSVLDRLPDGMQTTLGESGALVSGGEGQRVRLARSLLRRDASLILLDEPFRGLDRERRHALLGRARDWWKEATLLCVTHDVAETRVFDRVVVIADGAVVEDGPPAQLAADPTSRYRAMLDDEERLLAEVWGSRGWRRLRLDAGQVLEGIPSIAEARAAALRAEKGSS